MFAKRRRGLAEAVEGATWRWRNSARQSVRCLPPKTRARGSARRQVRHKARVEPLARRLGQYAAIVALHQVVCSKRRGPLRAVRTGLKPAMYGRSRAMPLFTPESQVRSDSPLEEARFEPSVPLWLGAFTRLKTSMSGPVGVGGFEEGEFEGDGPLEKVAAQILLRGADAVQLRAQEIDEAAKPRIVVQSDPLGVHEIDRQRLRRAGGPVEIQPFGHDEDRKRGGIAARFCGLAHDRLEAGGRLRIGICRAPVLGDAEGLESAEEIGVLLARHHADEATEPNPGL